MYATPNTFGKQYSGGFYKQKSDDKGETYQEKLDQIDPDLLEKWRKEQNYLKSLLIEKDDFDFAMDENDKTKPQLTLIAGVDLSFCKKDSTKAIAAIVVIDAFTWDIKYEKYDLVTLSQPYVPGFLAFREVEHIVKLINDLKKGNSNLFPQMILVDGNGILHINRFGLACHLGVLTGLPTIGCAKTIFAVDGINKVYLEEIKSKYLKRNGDCCDLKGKSGKIWATAYCNKISEEPIIISIGHKVTLPTAVQIVAWVSDGQVPMPVKFADGRSRVLAKIYDKQGKFDPDYFIKNARKYPKEYTYDDY